MFWKVAVWWKDQGRRVVDGVAQWDEPPVVESRFRTGKKRNLWPDENGDVVIRGGGRLMSKRKCRHCSHAPVNRPRGLCWSCYYAPGVREKYPSTSKYARRQKPDALVPSKEPEPTAALPRTPEKIMVMMDRASRHESLFHPGDATMDIGDVREKRWRNKGHGLNGTGYESDLHRELEEAA